MLVGVEPLDPVSLAVGVAVLAAASVAASWLPAVRAAGVDPVEVLRSE